MRRVRRTTRSTSPRPAARTGAAAAAVVLAASLGLTACSSGSVSDPTKGAQSGQPGPGGPGPAAGSLLPDQDTRPPSALTGRELADRATALVAGASYHLTGTTTSGGDTTAVDIRVDSNHDAVQTLTHAGVAQTQIKSGGDVYASVDGMLAGAGSAVPEPASLKGTYLKTDAQSLDGDLIDPFSNTFSSGADVTKGGLMIQDGQSVWPLTVHGGDGTTTVMYVLAQGTPYPVRITAQGTDTIDLTVSDIGANAPVTPPPADMVIDQATLQQRMAGG